LSDSYEEEVSKAASAIREKAGSEPQVGIIAGSGLSWLSELLREEKRIPYDSIPGYPQSSVAGHGGSMYFGRVGEKRVLVLSGRKHYYEGEGLEKGEAAEFGSLWRVVMPVRILSELGIGTLILTNAAGGLNRNFSIGDLMLISDHINLAFRNPLIGPNLAGYGVRFPDMSNVYDEDLRSKAKAVALREGMELKEGVYVSVLGPTYETRAEVKMLGLIGADAVGMSTVPEAIASVHCGIRTVGLSYISNLVVADRVIKLTHEEVLEGASKVKDKLSRFLDAFIKEL
jgi:purine-nucleoside phosphorylase